jgi:uncharacterized protein (TIGR02996 family)
LALLAACKAAPDDDTLRLALADWLDEHDEPDRAAFIRAQIELTDPDRSGRRVCELISQIRLIRKKHESKWIGALKGRAYWISHDRGLIDVCITPEQFLSAPIASFCHTEQWAWVRELVLIHLKPDDIPKLARAKHLASVRYLDLRTGEIAPDGVTALADSGNLVDLLGFNVHVPMGTTGVHVIAESPCFANLRSLNLWRTPLPNTDAGTLASSPNLKRLTHLACHAYGLKAQGLGLLANSPNLASVESLELPHTRIGPKELAAASGSPLFARLRNLNLQYDRIGEAGATLLAGMLSNNLHTLCLENSGITPRAVEVLAASPRLAGLRKLNLRRTSSGDRGARAIARSPHLRNLTSLNLCATGLTHKGVAELGASPNAAGLRTLDIQQNSLGLKGAQAFVAAPNFTNLRELELSATELTGEALEVLVASPNLARVRKLGIAANPVGEKAIIALTQSPNLPELNRLFASDVGSSRGVMLSAKAVRALVDPNRLPSALWVYLGLNLKDPMRSVLEKRFGPGTSDMAEYRSELPLTHVGGKAATG